MTYHFCTLTATAVFEKDINFEFTTETIKATIDSILAQNDNECLVEWVLEALAEDLPGYKLPENFEDFDAWVKEDNYPDVIKFRDEDVHFPETETEGFEPTAKNEIVAIFKEMGLKVQKSKFGNYLIWYRP